MPSPSLDSVSDGFLSVLQPGGVPLGTLQTVKKRSPELPLRAPDDPMPALYFPPLSGNAELGGEAARSVNYRGFIVLTYIDAVPEQQTATAGAGVTVTLADVESAFMLNLELILDAFLKNPTLSGAVVFAGAIPAPGGGTTGSGVPIGLKAAAGGPIKDEFGATFVAYQISVPFVGRTTRF